MSIKSRKGFTLIELMIVIQIIAIIAAIAIPNLLSARKSANESRCIGNMRTIYTQASQSDYENMPDLKVLNGMEAEEGEEVESGGYVYTAHSHPDVFWHVTANPTDPGVTGDRYFYIDGTGVIRVSCTGPATGEDDPVNGETCDIEEQGEEVIEELAEESEEAAEMAEEELDLEEVEEEVVKALDRNGDGKLSYDEVANVDYLSLARRIRPQLSIGDANDQRLGDDSRILSIVEPFRRHVGVRLINAPVDLPSFKKFSPTITPIKRTFTPGVTLPSKARGKAKGLLRKRAERSTGFTKKKFNVRERLSTKKRAPKRSLSDWMQKNEKEIEQSEEESIDIDPDAKKLRAKHEKRAARAERKMQSRKQKVQRRSGRKVERSAERGFGFKEKEQPAKKRSSLRKRTRRTQSSVNRLESRRKQRLQRRAIPQNGVLVKPE